MPSSPTYDVLAVLLDVGLMLENSAVFQSQVGEQLIALRSIGLNVGVLTVARDRKLFEAVIGRRLHRAGVDVILTEDAGFLRNIWRLARVLRRKQRSDAIRFAYVRGIWGALVLWLANPSRRIPYVYDVRGALADETAASGASRVKQFMYSSLEAWSIRNAARVTAVSKALAELLRKTYGNKDISVIPCCVDVAAVSVTPATVRTRREQLRYGESDIVLVYSGGLSHYQQVPAMLSLWRRLLDDADLRFLLLTKDDPRTLPAIVGDLGAFGGRLQHRSLPWSEVPSALAAASIGFMLRDARELNRVASPVKFAEYLAAGLAVVASPGTGDASGLIEEHAVGVLVDPGDLDEGEHRVRDLVRQVRSEGPLLRERAKQLALSRYDWRAYANTYRDVYALPL